MTTTRSKAQGRAKATSALQELQELVDSLGPVRDLVEQIHRRPVELLRQVCAQHRERGGPVPDHSLGLSSYLGDVAIRALLVGGLIEQDTTDRHALQAYVPTSRGKELCDRIEAELAPAGGESAGQ